MSEKVRCPRCEQDYLQKVILVQLNRQAILCPECDALWLSEDDVRRPVEGDYGIRFFDFGTYMTDARRPVSRSESELRILGMLLCSKRDSEEK